MGFKLITMVLRASRVEVLATAVVGLVSGLCSAGVIVIVSSILTGVRSSSAQTVSIFVGLAVLAISGRIVSQILVIRYAQRSVLDLRVGLSRRVLATPLSTLETLGTGKLLAVLTEDVAVVTDAMGVVPFVLVNVATIVGCLGYLAWLSPPAFVMVVLFFVIGIFSYRLIEHRALSSMTAARQVQDRLVEHLMLMTKGLKELLLHHRRREDFLTNSLGSTAAAVRDHTVSALGAYTIAGAWAQCLLFVLLGVLLFLIPAVSTVSLTTVIAFAVILLYMLRPIDFLLQILPYLGRAEVSLAKVESLGLSLATPMGDSPPPATVRHWERLELCHVRYRYDTLDPDDAFELGPIDLSLHPGEIVFLVGGNGSGKSTLAKLVSGLYLPSQGAIRLDGITISDSAIERYRQMFTAVFADACVFPNVLRAGESEIEGQIAQYLSELHLQNKVKLGGNELATGGLSQGQYKRLALLCALLEDRPIFIFDEWAADQDPVFRNVFYREVLCELKRRGKLVIVISHDERFFDAADRIVKLAEGQVAGIAATVAARDGSPAADRVSPH